MFNPLKGIGFDAILTYISPAFFEVVPVFSLAMTAKKLAGNYLKPQPELSLCLAKIPSVWAVSGASASMDTLVFSDASRDTPGVILDPGQAVLRLFFAQLLCCNEVVIDLRSDTFKRTNDQTGFTTIWSPKPVWHAWDKSFIKAVRDLYIGFYMSDHQLFDRALKRLDLEAAKEIFVEYFGDGDQRAVSFELKNFSSIFHRVFVACKESKSKIHPEFLVLGLILVSLYEHLEHCAVPIDVRAAFDASYRIYQDK